MHKLASKGFTIVEIATVIVVLAILSSVSVVGYGSWQKSLANKEVQVELKGAIAAANQHKNFQNTYELTVPTKYKKGNNVTLTYAWGSDKRVCINATSSKYSEIQYYVTSEAGEPKTGQCPAAPIDLAADGNPTYGLGYSSSVVVVNFTDQRVEGSMTYFEFDSVNNATGYDVEYRKQPSTTWIRMVSNNPDTLYEEYLEFDAPNEIYEVRARAVMSGGATSDWSEIQTFRSFPGPTYLGQCENGGYPSLWAVAPETLPGVNITRFYHTTDVYNDGFRDVENKVSFGNGEVRYDLEPIDFFGNSPTVAYFVDSNGNTSYRTYNLTVPPAYGCYD